MITKEVHKNLFKKINDEIFSCGTRDSNEEEVNERILVDLGIDVRITTKEKSIWSGK